MVRLLHAGRLGDGAVTGEDDDGRSRPGYFRRQEEVDRHVQLCLSVQPDELTLEAAVETDALGDLGWQVCRLQKSPGAVSHTQQLPQLVAELGVPRFPRGPGRPRETVRRHGGGGTAERGQQRGGQSVVLLRLRPRRDAFHQSPAQFAHTACQPANCFLQLLDRCGLLSKALRQINGGLFYQHLMAVARFQFLLIAP